MTGHDMTVRTPCSELSGTVSETREHWTSQLVAAQPGAAAPSATADPLDTTVAVEHDGAVTPNPHRQDTLMADTKLEQKLIDYLQDMHALERAGQRHIVSMLETEKNEAILRDFRTHQQETNRHGELLEGCLVAHGESSATRKEIRDDHTAEVACTIRSEEIAMVQRIDQHRDLVIDRTLIDNGIEVPA